LIASDLLQVTRLSGEIGLSGSDIGQGPGSAPVSFAMTHGLHKAFADAFRFLGGDRPVPKIEVRFYPYAGLRHTIRIRSGRVYVRLSDITRDAPPDVHRALAFVLVARLLARRIPAIHERVYRDYSIKAETQRASDIARRSRGRKLISSPRGRVYDLERVFDRLNRVYFDNELVRPTITWSQRRTRRILGHHDSVLETITISKSLDSPDVPKWLLEYVMYHEMLHLKHPARMVNGRRVYHPGAFRADERRFPHYEDAQHWLERLSLQRRIPRVRAA